MMKMFIHDYIFNVQEITNTEIKHIQIHTFQTVINIMNKFFKGLINKFMKDGVSLHWLLEYMGIGFILPLRKT